MAVWNNHSNLILEIPKRYKKKRSLTLRLKVLLSFHSFCFLNGKKKQLYQESIMIIIQSGDRNGSAP